MSVRKLKPVTPGQRFRVVNGYDAITTDKPEKSLLAPKKRSGGRNSQGKMTMRYIGGGHKTKYRIIDFKRNKAGIPAEVASIQYDPNRTAFPALSSSLITHGIWMRFLDLSEPNKNVLPVARSEPFTI